MNPDGQAKGNREEARNQGRQNPASHDLAVVAGVAA
jgi:hypothetical protein